MTILHFAGAVFLFGGIAVAGWRQPQPRGRRIAWVIGVLVVFSGWLTLWHLGHYCRLGAMILVCWCVPMWLAYLAGWRLAGRWSPGWPRHGGRALIVAMVLWPLAAVRYAEMYSLPRWLLFLPEFTLGDFWRFLAYGWPALPLVALLVFLASVYHEHRRGGPELTRQMRAGVAAAGFLVMPLLNWYAAGMIDIYDAVEDEHPRALKYAFWCRPGSVNRPDVYGATPLHYARSAGMAAYLVESGADVNVKILRGWNTGRAPVHLAAWSGRTDVMRVLIAAGADVNVGDDVHWTPLHRASHENQLADMQILIEAGARINEGDNRGNTPLHWAACQGNGDAVALLLRAGADPRVRNNHGFTPVEVVNVKTPEVREIFGAAGDTAPIGEDDGGREAEGASLP